MYFRLGKIAENIKSLQRLNDIWRRFFGANKESQSQTTLAEPVNENLSQEQAASDQKTVGVFRPIRFTSFHYFERANLIYTFLLFSLPLDSLIVFWQFDLNTEIANMFNMATIPLLLLALLFLAKNRVFNALTGLSNFQRRLSFENKTYAWILGGIIVLLSVVKFAGSFERLSMVSIIFFFCVLIGAGTATYKAIIDKFNFDLRLSLDRVLWVEHMNRQIFALSVVPLFLIRLFSLFGALKVSALDLGIVNYISYLITSALLMCLLAPEQYQFQMPCKKCSMLTSRALQQLEGCPACAREIFELREEQLLVAE